MWLCMSICICAAAPPPVGLLCRGVYWTLTARELEPVVSGNRPVRQSAKWLKMHSRARARVLALFSGKMRSMARNRRSPVCFLREYGMSTFTFRYDFHLIYVYSSIYINYFSNDVMAVYDLPSRRYDDCGWWGVNGRELRWNVEWYTRASMPFSYSGINRRTFKWDGR